MVNSWHVHWLVHTSGLMASTQSRQVSWCSRLMWVGWCGWVDGGCVDAGGLVVGGLMWVGWCEWVDVGGWVDVSQLMGQFITIWSLPTCLSLKNRSTWEWRVVLTLLWVKHLGQSWDILGTHKWPEETMMGALQSLQQPCPWVRPFMQKC